MSAYAFRKGLLRELAEVFASAEEMVGGTWPPDEMDDERKRIRKLHREVVRVMRGQDSKEKVFVKRKATT